MQLLRKFTIGLLTSLFWTSLLSFGVLWGIAMVFGTPDTLKRSLKESGIYEVAVEQLITANTRQATEGGAGQLASDPNVQAAIQKAFPADSLEQNVTQVIDGTYDWLQGKSQTLQFNVNISESRQTLARELSAYAETRTASLPACPVGVLPSQTDPLTAECRPEGLSPAIVGAAVRDNVLNQGNFNKDQLSAETLRNNQGQTLTQQLAGVQRLFEWLKISLYLTAATGLLTAAGVMILHTPRREALGRLARTALFVGLSIGAFAVVAAWLVSRLATQLSQTAHNQLLQAKFALLAQLLLNELRTWWLGYAITIAVIGVIGLLVVRLTRPKPAALPPKPTPTTPIAPPDDSGRQVNQHSDHP